MKKNLLWTFARGGESVRDKHILTVLLIYTVNCERKSKMFWNHT